MSYLQVGRSVLGQRGYEAYALRIQGYKLPSWEELPQDARAAWIYAGEQVAKLALSAYEAAEEPCPATQPAPEGYPYK